MYRSHLDLSDCAVQLGRFLQDKPLFVSLMAVLAAGVATSGQVVRNQAPRAAEVTANDVYVRSGPSVNHYPVVKLSAGRRVTIVGEMGEWYEIQPPAGVFSFISGDYVDTANGKSGVVNGNNVRVRAGSALDDFASLKYVVQTKLSKGAEVTILGRNPDGFLRIKPPLGTTVWIHRDFVNGDLKGAAEAGPSPANPAAESSAANLSSGYMADSSDASVIEPRPAKTDESVAAAVADNARSATDMIRPLPKVSETMLSAIPPSKERTQLLEIDKAARSELAKPVEHRRFRPLIERYRAIADQDKEALPQLYAAARAKQLTYMAELVETVLNLRSLGGKAAIQRRALLEGRAKIREMLPPIPQALDVQGELRVSALYPPGSIPRRYRLVDTTGPKERTMGYVEIPEDSGIDPAAHIGHFVGVRASAKRLQAGGVNPVPIYIAGELVNLQPAADGASTAKD